MKRCPKCGESLDVSAFAIDNSKRDGLKTYCKACDNARSHAYYEAHRDEVIARVQAQREQLPEKLRRRSRGRLSSRRRSRRWWSSARKPVLTPLDAEARTSAGSSAATSSGWGSWSSACLAAWCSRSCLLRHRWQTRRYLSKRNVGPSARAAGGCAVRGGEDDRFLHRRLAAAPWAIWWTADAPLSCSATSSGTSRRTSAATCHRQAARAPRRAALDPRLDLENRAATR